VLVLYHGLVYYFAIPLSPADHLRRGRQSVETQWWGKSFSKYFAMTVWLLGGC